METKKTPKLTLKERYKSLESEFMKGLRKLAFSIGGSLTAVIVADKTLSLGLPTNVMEILGYGIAICVGIAGTTKFSVEEKPISKEEV
jgi:hypothetical protein